MSNVLSSARSDFFSCPFPVGTKKLDFFFPPQDLEWARESCVEGGRKRQNTENLPGRETSLYDTVKVDICHYILVQTHEL